MRISIVSSQVLVIGSMIAVCVICVKVSTYRVIIYRRCSFGLRFKYFFGSFKVNSDTLFRGTKNNTTEKFVLTERLSIRRSRETLAFTINADIIV